MGGYINLGDCLVLLGGWLLGPVYGAAAGAIGSLLADIFTGYLAYAPVTLVVKGLMAALASLLLHWGSKAFHERLLPARLISALLCELFMVLATFSMNFYCWEMELQRLPVFLGIYYKVAYPCCWLSH